MFSEEFSINRVRNVVEGILILILDFKGVESFGFACFFLSLLKTVIILLFINHVHSYKEYHVLKYVVGLDTRY